MLPKHQKGGYGIRPYGYELTKYTLQTRRDLRSHCGLVTLGEKQHTALFFKPLAQLRYLDAPPTRGHSGGSPAEILSPLFAQAQKVQNDTSCPVKRPIESRCETICTKFSDKIL